MLRKTALLAVAVALAAGTGASAATAALLKPCHGETYRYGAYVWDPTTQSWRRMCIEQ